MISAGDSALRQGLAAEHAAVYAFGVIGGRLDQQSSAFELAARTYDRHVTARDRLTERLGPDLAPPSATAYELPGPVNTQAQASALAARVEDRCSVVYAEVVAATVDADRAYGIDRLTDCATALLAWGGPPTALPGVGRV